VENSYVKHESDMITSLRNKGDTSLELESITEEAMEELET
jgi:hypothetical protein